MAGWLVYSTITNGSTYAQYRKLNENALPVLVHKVHLAGGTGLARKNGFSTPLGVKTEVSDEDMEFLKTNKSFQRHEKAGFVVFMKANKDPEVVAANMEQRDGSAPLVPSDFEPDKEPVVNQVVKKTSPAIKARVKRFGVR